MGINGYKWNIFRQESGTKKHHLFLFGACENTIPNLVTSHKSCRIPMAWISKSQRKKYSIVSSHCWIYIKLADIFLEWFPQKPAHHFVNCPVLTRFFPCSCRGSSMEKLLEEVLRGRGLWWIPRAASMGCKMVYIFTRNICQIVWRHTVWLFVDISDDN